MSHDLPVEHDPKEPVSAELHQQIAEQRADIEGCGVTVTAVRVPSGGGSPRFAVAFRSDTPMYKARMALEAQRYDVGQEMNGPALSFYVTKRVTPGEGWLR